MERNVTVSHHNYRRVRFRYREKLSRRDTNDARSPSSKNVGIRRNEERKTESSRRKTESRARIGKSTQRVEDGKDFPKQK